MRLTNKQLTSLLSVVGIVLGMFGGLLIANTYWAEKWQEYQDMTMFERMAVVFLFLITYHTGRKLDG